MGADQIQSGKKDVVNLKTTIVTANKCGCPVHNGIPVLPVVFGNLQTNLTDSDKNYFPHSLAPSMGLATALSSLPMGYLYVYEEVNDGKYWTVYSVSRNGEFEHNDSIELNATKPSDPVAAREEASEEITDAGSMKPKMACHISGHTHSDKFITLTEDSTYWLCFSHVQLGIEVLRKYQNDTALRNKRMQQFIPPKKTGNENAATITAAKDIEPVFHSRYSKASIEAAELDHPVMLNGYANAIVDAQVLLNEMQNAIPKNKRGEYQPMLVALPDPVGMAIAANAKRNYLFKQLNESSLDKEILRKKVNAILIKAIADDIEKQNDEKGFFTGELDSIFGDKSPDHIVYKHIDKAAYEAMLKPVAEEVRIKKLIPRIRTYYVQTMLAKDWKFIQEHDFDPDNDKSAKEHQRMVAQCVVGCGTDENNVGIPETFLKKFTGEKTIPTSTGMTAFEEFEKVMLPMFACTVPPEQNWLNRSLVELDPDLMKVIDTFSISERAADAGGAGVAYIATKIDQKTQAKIKATAAKRVTEYKELLIHTISSNLLKLPVDKMNQFIAKLDGIYFAQHNVVVVKHKHFVAAQEFDKVMGRILKVFGKSGKTVRASTKKFIKRTVQKVEKTANIDIRKPIVITELAEAKGKLNPYLNKEFAQQIDPTAFSELNNGDAIRHADLDLNKVEAQLQQQKAYINKGLGGLTGVVSAFVAYQQIVAIVRSAPELATMARTGKTLQLTEASLGTISTGLTLVSATMDAGSGAAQLMSKTAFATKLMVRASWVGVASAVFEVGSLTIYIVRKANDGNYASASAGFIAMISISASATAGLGASMVLSGTVVTFFGLTALPLLAIMAVGLVISYISRRLAHKFDDKAALPISYWLDSGVFGLKAARDASFAGYNPFVAHPVFASLEQDLAALQFAMSKMDIDETLSVQNTPMISPMAPTKEEMLANISHLKFNLTAAFHGYNESSHVIIKVVAETLTGETETIYKNEYRGDQKVEAYVFNRSHISTKKLKHTLNTDNGTYTLTIPDRFYDFALSRYSVANYTMLDEQYPDDVSEYYHKARLEIYYTPHSNVHPNYTHTYVAFCPSTDREFLAAREQAILNKIRK